MRLCKCVSVCTVCVQCVCSVSAVCVQCVCSVSAGCVTGAVSVNGIRVCVTVSGVLFVFVFVLHRNTV